MEASPTTSPPPDWSQMQREILCPLCDYNLRGLSEARCPECGYQFDWEEVIAASHRHPYLFEHHPRRNVWSFFSTLVHSAGPSKFWSRLQPTHRLMPERMLLYWFVIAVPTAIASTVVLAFQVHRNFGVMNGLAPLQGILYRLDELADTAFPCVIVCLIWPWLTLASLLIFRTTMRRARIKSGHVLRCVIYSSDVGIVMGIPVAFALAAMNPYYYISQFGTWIWAWSLSRNLAIPLTILSLVLFTGYRLSIAYRDYLRFPKPISTVVASQVMVILISIKIYLLLSGN